MLTTPPWICSNGLFSIYGIYRTSSCDECFRFVLVRGFILQGFKMIVNKLLKKESFKIIVMLAALDYAPHHRI